MSKTNDSGDAVLYFTDAEKATLLNEYFNTNPPNSVRFFPDRTQDIFEILSITEQEVEEIINILKSEKATGPDQIGNRLLKATSKTISKPLCILFNLSLETKCFPECWKIANVIPLYKKGETIIDLCRY